MLAIIGSLFGAVSVEGVRAYWDVNSCGPNGNDFNWSWCNYKEGDCPLYVHTNQCNTGYGVRDVFHTQSHGEKYHRDGCDYFYYSSYTCVGCYEPYHWEDQDGDTCQDYDRNGWCEASWQSHYWGPHGKTADEACCECQGGTRYCKLPNGQNVSANPSFLGTIHHNGQCLTCLCSTSGMAYCGPSSSGCRRRMDGDDEIADQVMVHASEYNEAELNDMDEDQLNAFLEELSSHPHAPLDPNATKPAKNPMASDMRRLAGKPSGKPAKILQN